MPREKAPKRDTSGDIPAWFMTYSDVITLLMTFFILLLTFASHEPERFERMQLQMFGAGGSDGIAGDNNDPLDRESVVFRYRPELSRLTRNGSEIAPHYSDLTREGLSDGLKDLEENSKLAHSERVTFSAAKNAILDQKGQLTESGRSQMATFARHLSRFPMHLSISVPDANDLSSAIQMAQLLTFEHKVPLGQVSISVQPMPVGNRIDFTMIREN
ncbi:MAG: flagellar motor protein MotB [Planctomycetaceae bacterium]